LKVTEISEWTIYDLSSELGIGNDKGVITFFNMLYTHSGKYNPANIMSESQNAWSDLEKQINIIANNISANNWKDAFYDNEINQCKFLYVIFFNVNQSCGIAILNTERFVVINCNDHYIKAAIEPEAYSSIIEIIKRCVQR
jgi:hypothetical protein